MMKMRLKKSNRIITLVAIIGICIPILLLCFSNSRAASVFQLQDISGERSALMGLRITGSLRDSYHKMAFTLEDGALRTDYHYYESNAQSLAGTPGYDSKGQWIGMFSPASTSVTVEGRMPAQAKKSSPPSSASLGEEQQAKEIILADSVDFCLNVTGWDEKGFPLQAYFKTDITYQSEEPAYAFQKTYQDGPTLTYMFPDYDEVGQTFRLRGKLVTIEGKHYATVLTNPTAKGIGGIYRIDRMDSPLNGSSGTMGHAVNIVPVDLRDGTVVVVGLEKIQDRLVLILSIDGRIVIQSYDTSGRLQGEVKPDIPAFYEGPVGYQCFQDGSVMSFSFYRDQAMVDHVVLVSLTVVPELKVSHTVDSFSIEDGRYIFVHHIQPVGDRLVVVSGAYDKQIQPEVRYQYSPEAYVDVFEGSGHKAQRVYRGKFMTDLKADDYVYQVPSLQDKWHIFSRRSLNIDTIGDSGQGGGEP